MRNNLGLGVMIRLLAGNSETIDAWNALKDKTIKDLHLDEEENKFVFTFTDNSKLILFDNGQSCCESRYMCTDGNDLKPHIGHKLSSIEVRNGPNVEDEYSTHEQQFARVTTTLGTFVLNNHNEHNGYYGGFSLELRYVAPPLAG